MIFAGDFLKCLGEKSKREVRACLEKADLGVLRLLLYSNLMLIASLAGCRGPFVVMVIDHDLVSAGFHGCREPERAVWELVELLESLPGVWYVKTKVDDDRVHAETVPYTYLWRFLWGW